jgi:hypothetical protein
VTTATTGGTANCTDADVDQIFLMWCSSAPCHGEPGGVVLPTDNDLYLFSPTRKTDFLRLGTECPSESIIDVNNPAASLLVTTLTRSAACGVMMPLGPPLDGALIDCVKGWVTDVAATASGVATEPAPGVGGGSAF